MEGYDNGKYNDYTTLLKMEVAVFGNSVKSGMYEKCI